MTNEEQEHRIIQGFPWRMLIDYGSLVFVIALITVCVTYCRVESARIEADCPGAEQETGD